LSYGPSFFNRYVGSRVLGDRYDRFAYAIVLS